MRVNYAIVFVSDMNRSVAFYRDVFGMTLRFQSPCWSEFATDGATLALHAAAPPRDDHTRAADPEAGHCRPGLRVVDLGAFHQRMLEKGVPCIQEPKQDFGVWIAQYADPDGLVVSVSGDMPGA